MGDAAQGFAGSDGVVAGGGAGVLAVDGLVVFVEVGGVGGAEAFVSIRRARALFLVDGEFLGVVDAVDAVVADVADAVAA